MQRAVFSGNLICNLINMFTEGENIIKYYFKTLRRCDSVQNGVVKAFRRLGLLMATDSSVPGGVRGG